jgi:hypothetical protein
MQPNADIEASAAAGVRNRDRARAKAQYSLFLGAVHQIQADLAVTPEYSMPWDVLVEAIKSGIVPSAGKLWALGCESIRFEELNTIKSSLDGSATVIFEQLPPDPVRFTDPLVYVFSSLPNDGKGSPKIVMLVQFKTHPMGDDDHFEINGLQRGTRIYKFGEPGHTISLVSLICSDVFDFLDPDAQATYDRGLVLHIQLNAKPRNAQYRLYRDRLLRFQGDATELICLNWARNVHEWSGGQEKLWSNISASAWYVKSEKFDDRDETLCANHQKGFYYTWLEPLRTHAMFLNFDAAIFQIEASKVAHIGVPAAVSRRRGPQLAKVSVWNEATGAWADQATAKDGFDAVLGESGSAQAEIQRVCAGSPFAVERVVALSAGKIVHGEEWHRVRFLDSCIIEASEVIRRITFCQDPTEDASEFRIERLKRCGHLFDILRDASKLPPSLVDLKDGVQLTWSVAFPHQNVMSPAGNRATAIYMGEGHSEVQIDRVTKRAAENLHRSSANAEESLRTKQRLAVWFRRDNTIVLNDPYRYAKIDQTGTASEFDIGRET